MPLTKTIQNFSKFYIDVLNLDFKYWSFYFVLFFDFFLKFKCEHTFLSISFLKKRHTEKVHLKVKNQIKIQWNEGVWTNFIKGIAKLVKQIKK